VTGLGIASPFSLCGDTVVQALALSRACATRSGTSFHSFCTAVEGWGGLTGRGSRRDG
jgi:hypothetical protein